MQESVFKYLWVDYQIHEQEGDDGRYQIADVWAA
jgi:hypothetical protein